VTSKEIAEALRLKGKELLQRPDVRCTVGDIVWFDHLADRIEAERDAPTGAMSLDRAITIIHDAQRQRDDALWRLRDERIVAERLKVERDKAEARELEAAESARVAHAMLVEEGAKRRKAEARASKAEDSEARTRYQHERLTAGKVCRLCGDLNGKPLGPAFIGAELCFPCSQAYGRGYDDAQQKAEARAKKTDEKCRRAWGFYHECAAKRHRDAQTKCDGCELRARAEKAEAETERQIDAKLRACKRAEKAEASAVAQRHSADHFQALAEKLEGRVKELTILLDNANIVAHAAAEHARTADARVAFLEGLLRSHPQVKSSIVISGESATAGPKEYAAARARVTAWETGVWDYLHELRRRAGLDQPEPAIAHIRADKGGHFTATQDEHGRVTILRPTDQPAPATPPAQVLTDCIATYVCVECGRAVPESDLVAPAGSRYAQGARICRSCARTPQSPAPRIWRCEKCNTVVAEREESHWLKVNGEIVPCSGRLIPGTFTPEEDAK